MAVVKFQKTRRDREVVAAVDLGASKATCLIALMTTSADGTRTPEIIGAALQGASAAGDEAALRAAVDAAERMAGERVKSVYCAAPGKALRRRRVGVELDIDGGRVTREDVAECLVRAMESASPEGYRALHVKPIVWRLDGEDAGKDPAGLAGSVLAAEALGVGARESCLSNFEASIEKTGLRIEEVFAGPLAAAEAVLSEDEKDLGVVCLDLGAGSTSFAVYERGALIDCGGIAVGGGHITRDIAQVFGAPVAQAERAKTLYGAVHVAAIEEHRLIDLPQLGDEEEIRISRAELATVISPRIEEIFELTAKRLPTDVKSRHGARRVVLTGGGSLLVGAREAAERILGMKARLGRPIAVAGAPDAATAPQFSACAGLVLLAAQQKSDARTLRREAPRAPAKGLIADVGSWLRDNF
jgi:cell division protein FtsA